jgi:hypothetical protein
MAALALDRAGNDAVSALTLLMGAISVVASRAGDRGKRAELLSIVSDIARSEATRSRMVGAVGGSIMIYAGQFRAALVPGGYEIVDKFSRKEIFIDGALAVRFRQQVQQLIDNEPTMEEIDDFLASFSSLMQQPVVLH